MSAMYPCYNGQTPTAVQECLATCFHNHRQRVLQRRARRGHPQAQQLVSDRGSPSNTLSIPQGSILTTNGKVGSFNVEEYVNRHLPQEWKKMQYKANIVETVTKVLPPSQQPDSSIEQYNTASTSVCDKAQEDFEEDRELSDLQRCICDCYVHCAPSASVQTQQQRTYVQQSNNVVPSVAPVIQQPSTRVVYINCNQPAPMLPTIQPPPPPPIQQVNEPIQSINTYQRPPMPYPVPCIPEIPAPPPIQPIIPPPVVPVPPQPSLPIPDCIPTTVQVPVLPPAPVLPPPAPFYPPQPVPMPIPVPCDIPTPSMPYQTRVPCVDQRTGLCLVPCPETQRYAYLPPAQRPELFCVELPPPQLQPPVPPPLPPPPPPPPPPQPIPEIPRPTIVQPPAPVIKEAVTQNQRWCAKCCCVPGKSLVKKVVYRQAQGAGAQEEQAFADFSSVLDQLETRISVRYGNEIMRDEGICVAGGYNEQLRVIDFPVQVSENSHVETESFTSEF